MNDLELQFSLKKYIIKSSLSGPRSPEEPFPSPHSFPPQPRIFPSAHWYTSSHVMKTSAQGPIHPPTRAFPSLTIAALLTLLVAGFTLMALLAYSSPLPSPATLHNDPTMSLGDNPPAPIISKSAVALPTHSTSPSGLLSIHTDSGMLSTHNRENPSNSTHSNSDSQGSQRGPTGTNFEDSGSGDWDAAFARENQAAQQGGGRLAPANSEVHGGGVH